MNRSCSKVPVKPRITSGLFFRLFAWSVVLLMVGTMSVAAAETAASTSSAPSSITIAATGDIDPPGAKVVSDTILAHMAQMEITAVLIAGDTNNGSNNPLESYQDLYKGTYDRFQDKIYPCPGNHDALSKPAFSGYCSFWGKAAHSPEMYYSFDLGGWHFICLDSVTLVNGDRPNDGSAEAERAKTKAARATAKAKRAKDKKGKREKGGKGKRGENKVEGAKAESVQGASEKAAAQLAWLKSDLAANPNKPIFVQWHYPYFAHGMHQGQPKMKPFWDILYAHGPAIVLVGHDHVYERYAPLDPDGKVVAETKGLQQFQICPGGAKPIPIEIPIAPGPASLKFHSGTHHVGYFTLYPDGGYRYTIDGIESSGKTTLIDMGCGNLLGGSVPKNAPTPAVTQ